MKQYVESLYGIFTGELLLSKTIAEQELSAEEREALCLEAEAHGIAICFAEDEGDFAEEEYTDAQPIS